MNRLLLASPVGALLAEYTPEGVRALRFHPPGVHPPTGTRDAPARGDALGERVARELEEYFAGGRREFTLPLAPAGTEFQRAVWAALRRIPYGETRSYGQLAGELGKPHASRAVGQANARNPLPIVVPCHRVLATGGGLGGYLGDWEEGRGVAIKQYLLGLEGVRVG